MKKIRIEKKDGRFTKDTAEKCLNTLNEVFASDKLAKFGLKRNAETFADLMNGGENAIKFYRALLEDNLAINSEVPVLAEEARKKVENLVAELRQYIDKLHSSGFAKGFTGSVSMVLTPERVRFDEESARVVLSDMGAEMLERLTCVYLTTEKQITAYNLAREIEKKINALGAVLKDSKFVPISSGILGWGLIDYTGNIAKLDRDNIENLARLK